MKIAVGTNLTSAFTGAWVFPLPRNLKTTNGEIDESQTCYRVQSQPVTLILKFVCCQNLYIAVEITEDTELIMCYSDHVLIKLHKDLPSFAQYSVNLNTCTLEWCIFLSWSTVDAYEHSAATELWTVRIQVSCAHILVCMVLVKWDLPIWQFGLTVFISTIQICRSHVCTRFTNIISHCSAQGKVCRQD